MVAIDLVFSEQKDGYQGFITVKSEEPVRYWLNISVLGFAVILTSLLAMVFLLIPIANAGLLGTDF